LPNFPIGSKNITKYKDPEKFRNFYGWWIVVATVLCFGLYSGTLFYGFGAFFLPVLTEFNATRSSLSVVFSFSKFETGILGPVEGLLIDRFGTRKLMFLAVILGGAGFLLLSRVNSLMMFGVVFILCVALWMHAAFNMVPMIATANWFIKKRSRAIGIGMAGIGLAGIIVPLLSWFIAQYGWREAFTIIGIVVWGIGIPLSLIMRHKPEQHGYLPDGETPSAPVGGRMTQVTDVGSSAAQTRETHPAEVDFTPRQALRTPAFWLISISFCLRLVTVSALALHFIPLLVDMGISLQTAGTMLGSIAAISVIGRIGIGWLGDIFDKRLLTAACLATIALGLFVLSRAEQLWQVAIFLAIYPIPYGGASVLVRSITGEFFGRKAFGTIYGFIGIALMVGTIVGPLVMGYIYDVTGSYQSALNLAALGCIIAIIFILSARHPVLSDHIVR